MNRSNSIKLWAGLNSGLALLLLALLLLGRGVQLLGPGTLLHQRDSGWIAAFFGFLALLGGFVVLLHTLVECGSGLSPAEKATLEEEIGIGWGVFFLGAVGTYLAAAWYGEAHLSGHHAVVRPGFCPHLAWLVIALMFLFGGLVLLFGNLLRRLSALAKRNAGLLANTIGWGVSMVTCGGLAAVLGPTLVRQKWLMSSGIVLMSVGVLSVLASFAARLRVSMTAAETEEAQQERVEKDPPVGRDHGDVASGGQ